jgi:hypothetical protein
MFDPEKLMIVGQALLKMWPIWVPMILWGGYCYVSEHRDDGHL